MGRFQEIGTEIGALVERKNTAYGSAFQVSSDVLRLFYPNGVKPEQYRDLCLTTRICDKLMRIASRKDAFGESPYGDIAGYAILGISADELDAPQVRVGMPTPSPNDRIEAAIRRMAEPVNINEVGTLLVTHR